MWHAADIAWRQAGPEAGVLCQGRKIDQWRGREGSHGHPVRITFRTTFREMFSSRQIALIGLP